MQKHQEIPITIEKEFHVTGEGFDEFLTRYNVYEKSKKQNFIGYVDLQDTINGIKVLYIKNQNTDLYKHFGQVADQIEVEHCLKRDIENPYIESFAAIGSHIKHFKRGKRFINEGINVYFNHITQNLQKGEQIITGFLELQKMYMPMNLINEIKEKIKTKQLLKGIK